MSILPQGKVLSMLNNWIGGNKKRLITLGLISLLSCGKREKPPGVLPEEEMAELIGEVYIVEEKVKKLNLPPDSAEDLSYLLSQRLLDSLSVPDSVFKESIAYYWDHPDEMNDVYTALVDSLNLREQKLSLPVTP
jgi:hypothetical protein